MIIDNPRSQHIGHRAFQAIAHFQPHAAVILGNQEQDAVIHLGPAHFPFVKYPARIGFNRIGYHCGHHQYKNLGALAFFKGFKFLFDIGLLRG